MSSTKRLFKRLKNGVDVRLWHDVGKERYSIWLSYEISEFEVYSFIFDGNDVSDEASYTKESRVNFSGFSEMIEYLNKKFPGLSYEF